MCMSGGRGVYVRRKRCVCQGCVCQEEEVCMSGGRGVYDKRMRYMDAIMYKL